MPPSDDSPARPTGPPPNPAEPESSHTRATKPPTRRQTMEVTTAWSKARLPDEPRIEQVRSPLPPLPLSSTPTKPPPPLPTVPPMSRTQSREMETTMVELDEDELEEYESGELEEDAGSAEDLARAPTPSSSTADADELPNLMADDPDERPEITRVEAAPISTERIEAEKAAAESIVTKPPPAPVFDGHADVSPDVSPDLSGVVAVRAADVSAVVKLGTTPVSQAPSAAASPELEGPPITDSVREARLVEAHETTKRAAFDEVKAAQDEVKKARLAEFLRLTGTPAAPEVRAKDDPRVGDSHDQMREEALAARRVEQDKRDRELREKARLEREAKSAMRVREVREEAEREITALRQGLPDSRLLDLSGIDDEIESALDSFFDDSPPDPEKK